MTPQRYRPGDRVRPCVDDIADWLGTILTPTTDPRSVLVLWDWFADSDEAIDEDLLEWDADQLVPA